MARQIITAPTGLVAPYEITDEKTGRAHVSCHPVLAISIDVDEDGSWWHASAIIEGEFDDSSDIGAIHPKREDCTTHGNSDCPPSDDHREFLAWRKAYHARKLAAK
ncbi:hypothetical protein [Nocardioides sp. WS12]|uniref:hypothetical protein n=1 Tax=Nocardioides sp. WS12 TaxID=2486272 RepID=UPI0015FCABED|nr:hypothetical protein [Nocardioides sp. WS12]